MVTKASAGATQSRSTDILVSPFSGEITSTFPSDPQDRFGQGMVRALSEPQLVGLPWLVRLCIGLTRIPASEDPSADFFTQEQTKLDALESELSLSATESPEKAAEQLAVVEALAQQYQQRSLQRGTDDEQEQYLQLAIQTYDTLAKVCDQSPFSEIKARRELYTGYRMLAMGDFEGAQAALQEAVDCPEAKAILERMARDALRMRNRAVLDVWSSYVEESQAHETDQKNGALYVASGTIQYFAEGDGKTELDRVREKWNVDRDLIHEVKVRLNSDQAVTVDEALRQIIANVDPKLKLRAQALLDQGKQFTDEGNHILPHLIRYASQAEPDAELTKDLLHDADQLGARESAVATPYGVYSFLKATNPVVKEECEKEIAAIENGKTLPDIVWDMIRTTGTDDLAQLAIMHGATKVGSFAKLATLGKLEGMGVTGYKALGIAYGTEVLAEGTTMWALNTGNDLLFHDPDKVLDTHRLLNTWGANLIMVGGLKATGALSKKYAPKIAEIFGQVQAGELTPAGQGMVVGINHLTGISGMVGTTQLNQGLGLSERPKGGIKASLVNDVFTYIKYGVAQKGVDHVLGADHVAAREQRQREIERKEDDLLAAARLAPQKYASRPMSESAPFRPISLESARNLLRFSKNPLLAPMWMLLGIDGLGEGGGKPLASKEKSRFQELQTTLSELQRKNLKDPAIAEQYSVIADLLQSRGDPRGEWIALELKRQELSSINSDLQAIAVLDGKISKIRARAEADIKAQYGLVADYGFDASLGFSIKIRGDENKGATSQAFGLFLQSDYTRLLTSLEIAEFKSTQAWLLPDSNLSHLASLKKLTIRGSKLSAERIAAIAESPALGNLQILELESSNVGAKGARIIAESQTLGNLQILKLWGNNIGDRGARALAGSQTLGNLKILKLWGNNIGDRGARALAGSQILGNLLTLDLGNNNIGDKGASAIAASQTLGNLQTLDIGANNIGDDGARAIAASQTMNNLQTLNLWSNRIGAEGARALAESLILGDLHTLGLSCNNIGTEGARAIAASQTMNNLQTLNLWSNRIGAEGASAIANSSTLGKLQYLNLGENSIGDEGMRVIAASQTLGNLQILHLWSSNIGAEGARAIAASQTLGKLQTLNLMSNRIGAEGAHAIAESRTLGNLQNLDLSSNDIEVEGARAIAKSRTLGKLQTLKLHNNRIGVEGVRVIERSPNFPKLEVLNEQPIRRPAPPETSIPSDKDGKLQAIAAPALFGMDLLMNGHPTIAGILLSALAALASSGTVLGIFNRDGKGKGKTEAPIEKTSLQGLNDSLLAIWDKNPNDPAIAEQYAVIADRLLEQGDPRGEWIALELSRQELLSKRSDPQSIEVLESEICKVRSQIEADIKVRFGLVVKYQFDSTEGFRLKLSGNDNLEATSESFDRFIQSEYSALLTRLQIFMFNTHPINWILSESNLKHLTGLRELQVSESNMDAKQAREIADSQALSNLRSLDLGYNKLGDEGARAIAESQNLSNLQSLYLGDNRISDEGVRAIATSGTMTRLQTLDLTSNAICAGGAQTIAVSQALSQLRSLSLNSNYIYGMGAFDIANSPNLSQLKSLDLGNNGIGDEGAHAIADSQTLSNLQSLNLFRNGIGDVGAQTIASSQALTQLQSLSLDENDIGNEGARAIATSQTLTHLKSLYLSTNEIGVDGARAIAASQTLSRLQSLDLSTNEIGEEGEHAIVKSPYLSSLKTFDGLDINRTSPSSEENISSNDDGKLHAFAAPALFGMDLLMNGHPTIMGILISAFAALASSGAVMGIFNRDGKTNLQRLNDSLLAIWDENPQDPRIQEQFAVIADRLQEQGDPRGEWIALELSRQELLAKQSDPQAIAALNDKISKIRTQAEADIKNQFGLVTEYRFDATLGFSIKLQGDENKKATSQSFGRFLQSEYASLLTSLELANFQFTQGWFSESNVSHLNQLRCLEIRSSKLGAEGIRAIAASKTLGNLQILVLRVSHIGDDGARMIAESRTLGSLQTVNLGGNDIGDAGARAIAESQTFGKLISLDLESNSIGDAGARAIAASPSFGNLQVLDLGLNLIGTEGLRALASSSTLRNLQALALGFNNIGIEGARAIAESQALGKLESLDLRGNHIGAEGARAIATSPIFGDLQSLNFSWNNFGAEGARAIAESQTLGKLISLDLEGNRIGAAGAHAIAESQILGKLQVLNLGCNGIGTAGAHAIVTSQVLGNLYALGMKANEIDTEGARAIARSQIFGNLQILNLWDNNIGAAGVRAIAASKALGNLLTLNLRDNRIGDAGARAIERSPNFPNLEVLDGEPIRRSAPKGKVIPSKLKK